MIIATTDEAYLRCQQNSHSLISYRVLCASRRCSTTRNCVLREAVGGVSRRWITCEINRGTRVIDTAVQQAPIERRCNSTTKIDPIRSGSSNVRVTSDKVLVSKGVGVICTIVLWAEGHVGSGTSGWAVGGHATVQARASVVVVSGKACVREAVGICRGRTVVVSDSSATTQDITVIEAPGEGIGVGGIPIIADNLETTSNIIGCREDVCVTCVVVGRTSWLVGYCWLGRYRVARSTLASIATVSCAITTVAVG